MKRLLLDTSAYSHLMRGNKQIVKMLDEADDGLVLLTADHHFSLLPPDCV